MKNFQNSTIKKSIGNVACGVVITSARPSRRRFDIYVKYKSEF
jgi:hypothetical protein